MNKPMPLTLSLLFVATIHGLAANVISAAETVTVSLASGRTLTAKVDQRTDASRLWLRYGTDSTILIRPVRWEQIVTASHNGERITIDKLRQLAARSLAAGGNDEARSVGGEPAAKVDAAEPSATYAERAVHALGFRPRISSTQFDAYLSNWDRDIEADGLILQLLPLDKFGGMIPTDGVLHVEFVVLKQRGFNDAPRGRGQSPQVLGRWTKRIRSRDFGPEGLAVKLPFQASHPEFDTEWAQAGLVHMQFVVPGQGVYEHSEDGVRTRPYSPLRDQLERNQGRRFLSTETTGRGKFHRQ